MEVDGPGGEREDIHELCLHRSDPERTEERGREVFREEIGRRTNLLSIQNLTFGFCRLRQQVMTFNVHPRVQLNSCHGQSLIYLNALVIALEFCTQQNCKVHLKWCILTV